ncbi:MAG: aminodeoxychorismate lyase [Pseudomonadota bacterium]
MLWLDGEPLAAGAGLDRALEFGDGLFETIAVRDNRPRLLVRHLARLALGCERLGIAPQDPAVLKAEIARAARIPGVGVLKLIVSRGAGGRGYAADPLAPSRRWLALLTPRPRPARYAVDGVAVCTLTTRLAEQPLLAGIKHLNRLEQVLARRELDAASFAEGLMLDISGRVICGTMSNVYALIEGRVVTPSLARAGVEGVMRAALLDAWRAAGTEVVVRDLWPTELAGASELLLSNALIGVWPVASLDGRPYAPGPVTRTAATWVESW